MNVLYLYSRYVGVSFRSQMQYRLSFVMQSIGQFAVNATEFLVVWAMFHRFGGLAGWTLPEVAVLYGLVHVEWALTDAVSRGFDVFGGMVRNGDFDRILLRPRSTVLQLAGHELTLRRIGRFLQGFMVLVWGLSASGIVWAPAKAALLLGTVAGGVCMFYGLLIMQATVCFWTTEAIEITHVFTYGGLEAARYPITIYGDRFRRFFTFVIPLACVTYFPATALLDRPEILGYPAWFQWLSPCSGIIFLALALQIWKVGVRHYRSTGS